MIRPVSIAASITLSLAAGLGALPVQAQTPEAPPAAIDAPRAILPPEIAELRRQDERVLQLGYRLVTGNARFCADRTHTAGLLLHDMGAYGEGEALRGLLGLTGDIGVQALVPDGPAARAGLQVDDTVLAVGDLVIADIPTEKSKSWERIETIRAIEQEANRPIAIMMDLQGPKLRVGNFLDGAAYLDNGVPFRFDMDDTPGDATRVNLPHSEIFAALEPNSVLLVNDGKIRMRVMDCA